MMAALMGVQEDAMRLIAALATLSLLVGSACIGVGRGFLHCDAV